MTLSLSEVRSKVKQDFTSIDPTGLVLTHATPAGMNEAYRQLKALGWTSNREMHPIDRVPVFRLGPASIRRDRATVRTWIVEIEGETFDAEGSLADITVHVKSLLPKPAPVPLSPAAEAAADLEAQHGKLGGRIERALKLVEQGVTEFPHYHTEIDEATGISGCDCPDRAPWVSSGNTIGIMTYHNGKACKHALAQRIDYIVTHRQEQVAYRKASDRAERRARALPATSAGSIEDMLGYTRPPVTVAEQIAAVRAGIPALDNQQRGFNGAARLNNFCGYRE